MTWNKNFDTKLLNEQEEVNHKQTSTWSGPIVTPANSNRESHSSATFDFKVRTRRLLFIFLTLLWSCDRGWRRGLAVLFLHGSFTLLLPHPPAAPPAAPVVPPLKDLWGWVEAGRVCRSRLRRLPHLHQRRLPVRSHGGAAVPLQAWAGLTHTRTHIRTHTRMTIEMSIPSYNIEPEKRWVAIWKSIAIEKSKLPQFYTIWGKGITNIKLSCILLFYFNAGVCV